MQDTKVAQGVYCMAGPLIKKLKKILSNSVSLIAMGILKKGTKFGEDTFKGVTDLNLTA